MCVLYEFFPASNSSDFSFSGGSGVFVCACFCVEDRENANRFFFSGGVVEGDSGFG